MFAENGKNGDVGIMEIMIEDAEFEEQGQRVSYGPWMFSNKEKKWK